MSDPLCFVTFTFWNPIQCFLAKFSEELTITITRYNVQLVTRV